MSKFFGADYQVFQCDDRIPSPLHYNLQDNWFQFTDILWPQSNGLNAGYLLKAVSYNTITSTKGARPQWTVGDTSWQLKYLLTLNPLRLNNFYIANKTAGVIVYENGILTDENGNDITGLTSGSLIEFLPSILTTVQMNDGLSAKWSILIKDTNYP
jgi:hypothetical protein